MGRYVKSTSTDNLSRSLKYKFMAVPPCKAKSLISLIKGNTLINKSTWLLYFRCIILSDFFGDGYFVFSNVTSLIYITSLPLPQLYFIDIQIFKPRVFCLFC